ncbi:hypothetical protein ACJMK2_026754 [Sinanodonta woodiana]|uniref:MD-2-related lipid-recognition domain-containing protein n=1 Tax=Sinanodonta woodiana TaxID=1069815 RepID=A0ABD3XL12_SINWO
MNLVVLFLISQILSAALSTTESLFDLFELPWLQLDTDSLRSPPSLLGSDGPGLPDMSMGYMENCDPTSKYNISWQPKDIDPHSPLEVFVNYTAPAEFDEGEFSWDIKYRFIHVIKTEKISCTKIAEFCPLTKGGFLSFNYLVGVGTVIRFKKFKGTFKVKAVAENKHHENLLCVKFTAKVI